MQEDVDDDVSEGERKIMTHTLKHNPFLRADILDLLELKTSVVEVVNLMRLNYF